MWCNKTTLKNWFRTGLKPTQEQFSNWMDSYWHKDEKLPITSIDDIENILAAKMDTQALAGYELQSQKGVAGGYVPLDEFVKISNEYLTIVNDFVTGGATAIASAETVKELKLQIEGINAILGSDNIDLDTVQEIVDAIELLQGSLGLVLVNDLTTGGVTKALTAEMGKTLKDLIDGVCDYINTVEGTIETSIVALDNNVVHRTGNEAIAGIKRLLDELEFFKGLYVNTLNWPETTSDRIVNLPDASGTVTLNDNPAPIYAPSFHSSSDKRLKNIIDKEYGDVSELQAVAFNWKDESKGQNKQLGYLAQDVRKLMPDAVTSDKNGFLAVNYIEVLVAKVESLEKRIKTLENGVE